MAPSLRMGHAGSDAGFGNAQDAPLSCGFAGRNERSKCNCDRGAVDHRDPSVSFPGESTFAARSARRHSIKFPTSKEVR
jgi:hypothetical protein